MNDRHRFRVFDKQLGKYVTNNLLLITSQSWLYVDGKCVSLEEPDRYIIEFCTGLSASKSYRGDKPEDLLLWENDKIRFYNGNIGEKSISVIQFNKKYAQYGFYIGCSDWQTLDCSWQGNPPNGGRCDWYDITDMLEIVGTTHGEEK